ncbi:hypothetical protein NQ095_06230 [Rossellomorea sp. SC111]|uniref:hypothetical protein n=1 Tax=Rossellomorea sp. SC111 TaxID=2968985 RepID=UPI00215ACDB6|nr:hypothetical protein [Rossellomorea sp. SC111]MCR8847999.1 hypothetical protein [Rossellomorea sp. SC111]
MEKQILEILLDLRGEMKEVRSDMKEFRSELMTTQADVRSIRSDLKQTQADVKNIKATVDRIEASQTEDVLALIKVTKQTIDSEFHYVNAKTTDIDKRVFNLENRVER